MSDIRLFLLYLRERLPRIVISILSVGIFAAVFALYGMDLRAVIYPAFLCAAVSAVYTAVDFLRVRRRYKLISDIAGRGSEALTLLPKPEGVIESACRQVTDAAADEIRAAKSEAARHIEAENEYFTMWAHQIKTPLASMRLNLAAEDSRLSRLISAELVRTEQYVDMVMAYIRLGSETRDLRIAEYELDPIIRGAVKRFASEFILRGLTLSFEPTSAVILTDGKWLSLVIEQLLSNSLKYTERGGVTISYQPDGQTLVISDTGIGIPKEDLPLVFERGYTGVSGRTDRHSSGIGLWLCRRICGDLGHGISIDSPGPSGEGTAVKIDLSRRHTEHE